MEREEAILTCPMRGCDWDYRPIAEVRFDVTVRVCMRHGANRGREVTFEYMAHSGMTLECLYAASLEVLGRKPWEEAVEGYGKAFISAHVFMLDTTVGATHFEELGISLPLQEFADAVMSRRALHMAVGKVTEDVGSGEGRARGRATVLILAEPRE